jgi:hypothetical protein
MCQQLISHQTQITTDVTARHVSKVNDGYLSRGALAAPLVLSFLGHPYLAVTHQPPHTFLLQAEDDRVDNVNDSLLTTLR